MDIVPNKGWQIVKQPNKLTILIVAKTGVTEEFVRQQIAAALEKKGVVVPKIEVEKVDAIPKDPSGKSPLIKVAQHE
jgi:hypothetical protein